MSPSKSRSRSEDRRAASLRRHVERELVEGLATRERRSLIERLRGNVEQRRDWDRAVAGFRALEQREVSNFELDQVERWLFEDLDESGLLAEARPEPSRRWTYLAATLATLAAAASLLLWLDEDPAPPTIASITLDTIASNTLQARGDHGDHGWTRPLALELVCGEPARPAAARGCGLDELLGFSLRLGDEALDPEAASALGQAPLHLSVFGIAAEGELLYYTPTPDEPALASARLGAGWQALPRSVRLEVNHHPGRVRVFALASDRAVELADIDRWAAALAHQAPATLDDPPWHLRLAPDLLDAACRDLMRCASAETELRILTFAPEAPRTDP